jgi:hypothetical protein
VTHALSACGGLVDASPNKGVRDATARSAVDARVQLDVITDAASPNAAQTPDAADASDGPIVDAIADGSASDVDPTLGVLPSTAMCLTGGNVLWIEGGPGNFWFTGTQLDTDTSIWYAEAISDYSMPYDGVLIEVTPAGVSPPGTRWGLTFNSWASRTPLLPGFTYDGSQFLGDSTIGYLATCAAATGSFRVDTFTGTPLDGGLGGVTDFTAAFSFGCEGSAGALSGCVHYASN